MCLCVCVCVCVWEWEWEWERERERERLWWHVAAKKETNEIELEMSSVSVTVFDDGNNWVCFNVDTTKLLRYFWKWHRYFVFLLKVFPRLSKNDFHRSKGQFVLLHLWWTICIFLTLILGNILQVSSDFFGQFSLLPAFLQLVFQPLMSAQTGFLVGAWQPSGLDF